MADSSAKTAPAGFMAVRRRLLPAKGSFSANVLTLMTGTTLAQGLAIAAAPILTRLYTPADFGIYAIFTSLTGILSVLATGRYEFAIMLPHRDEDAANLLALSGLIAVGLSALTLVIVALFRQAIAGLLRAPELAPWLWWAPVSILLAGCYQALNYWSNRQKQYSRLAISRGGQAAGAVGLQLGAGLLGPAGAGGLIAGNLAGQAFGVTLLSRLTGRQDAAALQEAVSWGAMRRQAREYRRFPLYDIWAGLANLGAHQLPPLFLNFFFGAATAGFFSLGYRVVNLPLTLINASFAQVFFQRYEEKRQTGGKQEFLWHTLKLLTALTGLPALLLFLFSPWLFGIVFGPEWVTAGEYVRILTPLLLCRFIASPVTTVLWSEGKNAWLLFWQCSLVLATLLAFGVGGFFGASLSLGLFSLLGSLLYILVIGLIVRSAEARS